MLSLEEQIERIADSAVHAIAVEHPVGSTHERNSHRRRAPLMSAALVAAAVALVVVGLLLGGEPSRDTEATTPTSAAPTIASSTSAADSIRPTVWWSGLGQLPDDLATIPLPPPGTITLLAVDGRPVLVERTGDQFCILDGPAGGGSCTQITENATTVELQHGGISGLTADGTALPKFSYWLTSDALTVAYVDTHGAAACDEGPQPVPAYSGVTLWTCISSGTTPPGETRSIYRADDIDYLAGPD
ncbi:MAG: hypothetical protein RL238_1255 [Actinomycetota bacterium]|jgi:hypothetical protein